MKICCQREHNAMPVEYWAAHLEINELRLGYSGLKYVFSITPLRKGTRLNVRTHREYVLWKVTKRMRRLIHDAFTKYSVVTNVHVDAVKSNPYAVNKCWYIYI